jgi:hypothetical protein
LARAWIVAAEREVHLTPGCDVGLDGPEPQPQLAVPWLYAHLHPSPKPRHDALPLTIVAKIAKHGESQRRVERPTTPRPHEHAAKSLRVAIVCRRVGHPVAKHGDALRFRPQCQALRVLEVVNRRCWQARSRIEKRRHLTLPPQCDGSLPGVADPVLRSVLALGAAVLLALGLTRVRRIPRDAAMVGYAVVVVVLGIFAFLGPSAAIVGGAVVLLALGIGALIYGALALAARWASR